VAQAARHPAVEYRVAPAEASGLPDESADVVTVAQAAHWFDRPRFFAEARRVVRPRGVVALWTYNLLATGTPAVDEMVTHFYADTLGPWWSSERRLVEEGYRSIDFPFEEIEVPSFDMRARWTLEQLLGFLRSWSAVDRYRRETGDDPVTPLGERLRAHWGDANEVREISWPVSFRVGRVPAR
jgi:SAM-dependent methyltransferase